MPDSLSNSINYSFSDWDSYVVGNYLVVTWFSHWYTGGAHGGSFIDAEQFDLRTGKLLTKDDVFMDIVADAPVINAIITRRLIEEHDWEQTPPNEAIDVCSDSVPLLFRLTPEGIVFIYNEYAIAAFAAGAYQVLAPYDELRSFLKVEI